MNWSSKSKKQGTDNDEALLVRYRQSGDIALLAELFQRHAHALYYVCYRYLQDGEQSKDAVMHIFEELVQKVNQQEIKQFGGWLYVLSRNYCLMQLRASKKIQYINYEDFMEFPVDLHHGAENKEKRLTVMELCLEKLPEAQKQSVHLFFIKERCYKEITEITGYTLNEVKSYIQNGKRNLKICMEKNGER